MYYSRRQADLFTIYKYSFLVAIANEIFAKSIYSTNQNRADRRKISNVSCHDVIIVDISDLSVLLFLRTQCNANMQLWAIQAMASRARCYDTSIPWRIAKTQTTAPKR